MARNRRITSKNGSGSNQARRNPPQGVGRRDFLKLAGLSASAAGIPQLLGCNVESISETSAAVSADVTANLIRKTDFVVLRFEFINMRLGAGGTKLVSKSNGDRLMIVNYPPQHLLEAANNENPKKNADPRSPIILRWMHALPARAVSCSGFPTASTRSISTRSRYSRRAPSSR